ncbi:hypothetical protein PMI38_00739 [Pseudomonas sp. GM84]|nr:hypothetical protein PMI38_00739 [Pseudomonas sp. GM84]
MIFIPFYTAQALSALKTFQPTQNVKRICKDCKFIANGNDSQLLVTIAYTMIRGLHTLGKVHNNA